MRRREFIGVVGGAVAWPLAAGAEPTRNKYRLAFLTPVALNRDYRPPKEFFDELSRAGYVEGQNIVVEPLSTEGKSERRSEVARDAVRGNPDAIFVITGPLTQAVKDVTTRVTDVAMEHSFCELGRFSGAYRSVFRESPKDTLRRQSNQIGRIS
jgi:putative ABC transport system substrate-binding protein